MGYNGYGYDGQCYDYSNTSGDGSYYGYVVPSNKSHPDSQKGQNSNYGQGSQTSQEQKGLDGSRHNSMQKKFYDEKCSDNLETSNPLQTPDAVQSPGLKNL